MLLILLKDNIGRDDDYRIIVKYGVQVETTMFAILVRTTPIIRSYLSTNTFIFFHQKWRNQIQSRLPVITTINELACSVNAEPIKCGVDGY